MCAAEFGCLCPGAGRGLCQKGGELRLDRLVPGLIGHEVEDGRGIMGCEGIQDGLDLRSCLVGDNALIDIRFAATRHNKQDRRKQ